MSKKCETLSKVILFLTVFLVFINTTMASKPHAAVIDKNLKNLTLDFKVKNTSEVRKRIDFYIKKHRNQSRLILGKALMYKSIFSSIAKEQNVPEELVFLPIIESELNPQAVSNQGATGLWQFMSTTAKGKGLQINNLVDERKDPIKSTEAAISYLKELHAKYKDWSIALAAYNCGPRHVDNAIRKTRRAKNFWDIDHLLPSETRNYVPNFIAAVYLVRYHEEHGIVPRYPKNNIQLTFTAKVCEKISLQTLSTELDISYSVLKSLNPSYTKGIVPKSKGGNYVNIPHSAMSTFLSNGRSSDDIIYSPDFITVSDPTPSGFDLVVTDESGEPTTSDLSDLVKSTNNPNPFEPQRSNDVINASPIINDRVYKYVKVGRGRTLRDIAYDHNIGINTLLAENNYNFNNLPKQGDIIKVPFN